MNRVGGIVLCGGKSSRMGRAKAWLPFGDELMLQRVVRIIAGVVRPVVVVAAPDQEVPPLPPGVLLARDEVGGHGPLQGLAAGLAALEGQCDAVYLSSCDVPLLRPAFIQRMIDLLGRYSTCVPKVEDRLHPLAAVYRHNVAGAVQRLLAENQMRLGSLVDDVPTRTVLAHELTDVDPALCSLQNMNTPEDYKVALRELSNALHLGDVR